MQSLTLQLALLPFCLCSPALPLKLNFSEMFWHLCIYACMWHAHIINIIRVGVHARI